MSSRDFPGTVGSIFTDPNFPGPNSNFYFPRPSPNFFHRSMQRPEIETDLKGKDPMLTDSQELLSDAQALTATAISTKVYDLLPSGGAVGSGRPGGPTANTTVNIGGEPLYLYIRVDTVLDSAGEAATLTATVESSADTSNGTPTVHWTSGSIAEATLATGYWVAKGVALPPGDYKRYICVNYTVGTENFTSGKVSAWFSDTPTYVEDLYSRGTVHGVN